MAARRKTRKKATARKAVRKKAITKRGRAGRKAAHRRKRETAFTGFSYTDEFETGYGATREVKVGGRYVPYLGPNRHVNVTNTRAHFQHPTPDDWPDHTDYGGEMPYVVSAEATMSEDGEGSVENR